MGKEEADEVGLDSLRGGVGGETREMEVLEGRFGRHG